MKIVIELTDRDDQEMLNKVLSAVAGTGDRVADVKIDVDPVVLTEPVEADDDAGNDTTAFVTQDADADQTVTSHSNGVETDSDGLPWDHRIHASTKTQTKDGKWKKKRGVDKELVDQVEAELKATMTAPAAEAAPAEAAPAEAEQPKADPLAGLVPPPPPPATTEQPTFTALLKKVSQLRSDEKMDDAAFESIYKSFNLPSFAAFNARPDLIAQAFEMVKAYE